MKPCTIEGCPNQCRSNSSPYCEKHYYRLRRTQSTELPAKNYSVNSDCFDHLDENNTWVLGLLWSDGNIRRNTVSLSSIDYDLLLQASTVFGASNVIRPYKNQNAYYIAFTDHKIANQLRVFGMMETKSLIIGWPNLPEQFECHFIRGVFDGDGCAQIDRKGVLRLEIVSGSLQFALELQKRLLAKDVTHSFITINTNRKNPLYRLAISSQKSCQQFRNLLYDNATMFLKRKLDVIQRWDSIPRRKPGRPKQISPVHSLSLEANTLLLIDSTYQSLSVLREPNGDI
jgi:hypothetical protein